MMAQPFRNNHQSCQHIEENVTLFMSEHTLFSCDLQWMPKDCHFAVNSLSRRLIQRAKRANLPSLILEHLNSYSIFYCKTLFCTVFRKNKVLDLETSFDVQNRMFRAKYNCGRNYFISLREFSLEE
jgi:hypothetical protein